MTNDTIFALSSGHGKSGVAVIRISGGDLKNDFQKIINRKNVSPRHSYFLNLKDEKGELIDQVIAVYFATPQSFTGEDVIEIFSHGAPAVIEKIFSFLQSLGAHMAEPGEFSRRAFYNGKMNLTDIDGLVALLDAQTDKQRKFALKSMTGFDSKIYEKWRNQMIEISAYAAAVLDYSADELPKNIQSKIKNQTKKLYTEITHTLSESSAVRAVQSGFNIVLSGKTNVGKSSIFNRLVGTNRAIVSDIPGTTRDIVSAALDIDGYLVNLSDTAGIHKAKNIIEKIGIKKTKTEIENSDLTIRVYAENVRLEPKHNELFVINKSDLIKDKKIKNAVYVSAKTGDGIKNLMKEIRKKIHELTDNTESALAINARTKGLLEDAAKELKNAMEKSGNDFDIFAEHVHTAANDIGKILGTITTSEIMDATFSQLCLGK